MRDWSRSTAPLTTALMDAVKPVEGDGVFFHGEASVEKSSCLAQSGLHLHVYMGIWGSHCIIRTIY